MVVSGTAIHVCPNWYGFSPLSLSTKQLSRKSAGGDVLHHLGSKAESHVYQSFQVQVNYEVAPVARPILSVDMLTRKGVLVVFGVHGDSSFIQLPDGHKIPMNRAKVAIVSNATLVDRRNMKCDLVAPVVPTEVPLVVETRDEEVRDSENAHSSDYEAPQILVLGGTREVNRSKQPTESERRRHELSHLPHVPWCTFCRRARTTDDPHHVVTHDESVLFPKIVCGYAEIKMKGDTTPVRVLLVVDSSTGYLRSTDVDRKGGSSGFAAKWVAKWLEATGYARMKVQSDAEQSIAHLPKAVKSICTADVIAQWAPVKSHQSQGHVESTVC